MKVLLEKLKYQNKHIYHFPLKDQMHIWAYAADLSVISMHTRRDIAFELE